VASGAEYEFRICRPETHGVTRLSMATRSASNRANLKRKSRWLGPVATTLSLSCGSRTAVSAERNVEPAPLRVSRRAACAGGIVAHPTKVI